jgi:drug/metabolite transporter (DMT)-like permease
VRLKSFIHIPKAAQHMLLSTLAFAVMNVFLKKVSHLPSMEIVLFRCLVSLIICLYILKKANEDWRGSNRKLLLARGIFGTLALFTFFKTLGEMPLGTAVTIQYLSPIFTTIIAVFFLKERVKSIQWLFFTISFAGVFIIKGFDSHISLGSFMFGVSSAMFSGFAYNMVRSLKGKEHTMVVVLHFQLVGVVAGFLFTIFNWVTPSPLEWFYMLMIGLCTQIGQVQLTKALQMEKVANVTILNYLGVIYALVFSYTIFGETYPRTAIAGIFLVMIGIVLNFFYQKYDSRVVAEEELTTIEE